MHLGIRETIL